MRIGRHVACVTLGILGLTSLGGCSETDRPEPAAGRPDTGSPSSATKEALPAGLFAAETPANAKDISEVRSAAKDGEEVLVRGRVGGRPKPFVDARAAMILTDMGMAPCNTIPGDTCSTPWDYCCEPPEEVARKSVLVQVAGADGKPAKASLEGSGGLQPLSTVVVRGKVQRGPDDKTLAINATSIHVEPVEPARAAQ